MKTTTIIAALLAATASVMAKSCNRGGVYCGTSLLKKGDYRNHIIQTLQSVRQPTDESHILYSKFDCVDNGDIVWRQYCAKGCGGDTTKDPDYCL